MPKKKSSKKKAAPKKVAARPAPRPIKRAQKPPTEVKASGPIGPMRELNTPSPTPGFELPTEVSPQIREAYKSKFEETQLSEIGRESSVAEKQAREKAISEMGTPAEPEAIKAVRGETSIPAAERPLTPKPTPEEEPTPGQQAKRQAGRLPRGAGRTGPFTFQTATRDEGTVGIKTIRDIARQSQKGRDISPLPPHVQATALALARRDHELAKSSGKVVNEISPESFTPDEYSIRGTHHERLAEAIHAYGVKEEDFAKIPGKADLPTKVSLAWSALKEHERSKRKTPLWPESEGATHWEDPKTKKVQPIALGGHPEFYRHEGKTESLVRGKGESSWKAVSPVTEGWHVINLRGQKTWTFRGHPAEPYKNTHQTRSLFQHIQNTLKGTFPEAPIRSTSDSQDSRRRAAERVREKFIVMRPEPEEAGFFSKRAVKESGVRRQRGRTQRTMVGQPVNRIASELTVNRTGGNLAVSRADVYKPNVKPDNITVENTPEVERIVGPKRIEPRRPKVVQEASGRRVVRPKRRDESKKVGYMYQPGMPLGVKSEATKQIEKQQKQAELLPPTGRPKTAFTTTVVPAEPKKPKSTKLKKVYTPLPKAEEQMLPGMESYGYEQPATPARKVKKLVPVEGPITAGQAEAEKVASSTPFSSSELNLLKGRVSIVVETEVKGTPAIPGSARPKPETGASIGETGMEQLQYIKKQYGGVIPSPSREVVKAYKTPRTKKVKVEQKTQLTGTDLAASRNIPQQLELPGLESPGYAGAMGQQFRRVSPQTRALQLASQQGAVPGVAADLPKGVAPKKSTRSFKGRK